MKTTEGIVSGGVRVNYPVNSLFIITSFTVNKGPAVYIRRYHQRRTAGMCPYVIIRKTESTGTTIPPAGIALLA